MIWGWLAVCILTLAVAYSMAEMCSAYVKCLGMGS
jgi:choline transport protein